MMKYIISIVVLILLNSCTLSGVKNAFVGHHYLDSKEYDDGEQYFSEGITATHETASSHYFYGRFLLINGKSTQALSQFEEAVQLDPSDADYLFWRGLAYGITGQSLQERKSYEAALQQSPRHYKAMLYLAHLQLLNKE